MLRAIWEFAQSRDCVRILGIPRLHNMCAQSQDPRATVRPTVSDLLIFRYSAGTRVTIVVAYSGFTSKSPDYVLVCFQPS